MPIRVRSVACVGVLAVAVIGAACTDDSDPRVTSDRGEGASSTKVTRPPATTTTLAPWEHLVGRAEGPLLEVFDAPGAPAPLQTLENPNEAGAPLVVLVDREEGDWLQVLLPVRPNGSTGWVRRDDVALARVSYELVIELSAFRLTLYDKGQPVLESAVGLGTGNTPTPDGRYYLTELLRPPDPDGAYGPYAYGLSGFSEALEAFNGGPGQVGLHGTNDPSSIGRESSHGCIRVPNEIITELADKLPLGTPVQILP